VNIVGSFDRRGQMIYTGNAKGKVSAFKIPSMELVASFRIGGQSSSTSVKSIEFARRGEYAYIKPNDILNNNKLLFFNDFMLICRWFLVNSADRILRVYDSREVIKCGVDGDPEPIQKLQDLVNKYVLRNLMFAFNTKLFKIVYALISGQCGKNVAFLGTENIFVLVQLDNMLFIFGSGLWETW